MERAQKRAEYRPNPPLLATEIVTDYARTQEAATADCDDRRLPMHSLSPGYSPATYAASGSSKVSVPVLTD